jgi:hypothetical protein
MLMAMSVPRRRETAMRRGGRRTRAQRRSEHAGGGAAAKGTGTAAAGLPPPLTRRQRRALVRSLAQRARPEHRYFVLELPLQADDEGWSAPLQERSASLPTAARPFIYGPYSNDAAAASARIERAVGAGHIRLLVSLRTRGACVVDATDVRHLRASAIEHDDPTAHALLEQLGRAGVDIVYLSGGVVLLFTGALGRRIDIRSMQQVEGARERGRRRRLLDGLTAFAWALVVAVALAFLGVEGAIDGLRDKLSLNRLVDAELPVWLLIAALLLATGVVTALRHRRCSGAFEFARPRIRRSHSADESDREQLLNA